MIKESRSWSRRSITMMQRCSQEQDRRERSSSFISRGMKRTRVAILTAARLVYLVSRYQLIRAKWPGRWKIARGIASRGDGRRIFVDRRVFQVKRSRHAESSRYQSVHVRGAADEWSRQPRYGPVTRDVIYNPAEVEAEDGRSVRHREAGHSPFFSFFFFFKFIFRAHVCLRELRLRAISVDGTSSHPIHVAMRIASQPRLRELNSRRARTIWWEGEE